MKLARSLVTWSSTGLGSQDRYRADVISAATPACALRESVDPKALDPWQWPPRYHHVETTAVSTASA